MSVTWNKMCPARSWRNCLCSKKCLHAINHCDPLQADRRNLALSNILSTVLKFASPVAEKWQPYFEAFVSEVLFFFFFSIPHCALSFVVSRIVTRLSPMVILFLLLTVLWNSTKQQPCFLAVPTLTLIFGREKDVGVIVWTQCDVFF